MAEICKRIMWPVWHICIVIVSDAFFFFLREKPSIVSLSSRTECEGSALLEAECSAAEMSSARKEIVTRARATQQEPEERTKNSKLGFKFLMQQGHAYKANRCFFTYYKSCRSCCMKTLHDLLWPCRSLQNVHSCGALYVVVRPGLGIRWLLKCGAAGIHHREVSSQSCCFTCRFTTHSTEESSNQENGGFLPPPPTKQNKQKQ